MTLSIRPAGLFRACAILAAVAAFAPVSAQGDCPEGNLLAWKVPLERLDVYDVSRITDGVVSTDGAPWNNATTARMTPYGYATYDLGIETGLAALFVQADGNSRYGIATSLDAVQWSPLTVVPALDSDGMGNRFARGLDTRARYVRIVSGPERKPYSIGEMALWCREPESWPPRFEARDGIVRDAGWSADRKRRIAYGKFVFLVLGTALLLAARRMPRARRWICAAVVAGGALAWTNFGTFHGPNYIHYHEHFHYYLGSQYFNENGYTGLYGCTVKAERDLGLETVARNRYVTDLEDNLLVAGGELLDTELPCRAEFTEERWESFREDVRYFRNHLYPGSWQRVFRDHGYNPTPVWTMLGRAASVLGSDAATSVPRLAWIDVVLLLGIAALVFWAYGWETLGLAALILGGGLPWDFTFNGGAFARYAWLFCLVAGLCLLKKDRPAAAGGALAAAAALRVFPAVFLVVLAIAATVALIRKRSVAVYVRLFGGAAAAGILLIVLSLVTVGPASWSGFLDNLRKHATTPVGNTMGIPAIASYGANSAQSEILTGEIESLERWRLARAETLRERRVAVWGLGALFVGFCTWTVLRRDWPSWEWVVVALLPAVSLGQVNAYYYVFLVLLAPWVAGRQLGLGLLLAALAASQGIGLSGWPTDVRYVALSVVFVLLTTALWVLRVREVSSDGP